MQKTNTPFKQNAGFTLIELVIASAIGAFLLAGVFTVFSNGRQTQRVVDVQTQLIDDGRFALTTLSYDIRHAGLWGNSTDYSKMAGALNVTTDAYDTDKISAPAMPVVPGDCTNGWYRDLENSFWVANNMNPYIGSGCIPNGEYRPNTDVLVTKYAPPAVVEPDDAASNIVYIFSSINDRQLFVGTVPTWGQDVADDHIPKIFRLRTRAYYVSEFTNIAGDGIPSLTRVDLGAGPSLTNTMMVPGVEDFQVQLGIDTDNDNAVNMYVDADNPAVGPTMKNVISVQFWALIRSEGTNELAAGETQTLSVAGRPAVTYSDGRRRIVVSYVERLRNRFDHTNSAGSN